MTVEMMEIVEHAIDVAAVTAAVADPATGATVTFIGTTRDHNDGRQVTQLEYEAYPEMALAEMRKIGATAKERWPITSGAGEWHWPKCPRSGGPRRSAGRSARSPSSIASVRCRSVRLAW